MSCSDFSSIARTIYEHRNLKISYANTQRSLIKTLYAAYVRLAEQSAMPLFIETEGDAINACDIIYEWYSDHYYDKKKPQNRGISKNITFKNTYRSPLSTISVYRKVDGVQKRETKDLYGTYYFNEPYEKRQFEKYLVKPEMPKRNEDFLAFILHTAVAFFLKPEELNIVLKEYGFQQLHVRNIHHLAIYVTLSRYWKPVGSPDLLDTAKDNPFDYVRSLYDQARIVINEATPEVKLRVFPNDQTNWIREQLLKADALRHDNYLAVIKENAGSFTMRHKTILDDHHKFASLFRFIFDKPYLGVANISDFSFYAFTNNFCCTHSEKKFREKIFDQIDKFGKHPTRELMICFWLYALCFAYTDGVGIEANVFDNIVKRLGQYNIEWADKINYYYDDGYLDVISYINNGKVEKKAYFKGADIVELIDAKLRNHYKWGTLDSRNPFDFYIDQLKYLEFGINSEGNPFNIRYKGETIRFRQPFPPTVPCTIAVIFELFMQLKVYDEYPLACNIYEQI